MNKYQLFVTRFLFYSVTIYSWNVFGDVDRYRNKK